MGAFCLCFVIYIIPWSKQGIIDPTRTETFAKEPKLAKLLEELKPTPESRN